jgi:hypothetical protein
MGRAIIEWSFYRALTSDDTTAEVADQAKQGIQRS